MPHDSQRMDPGPSAPGAIFRISDNNGKRQDVRIFKRELLRSRSLVLRKMLDDTKMNQEIPLKLGAIPDIDCDSVAWVVEHLQQSPEVDSNPKGLARHCAVLWKYQCIPDPFQSLGDTMQPRSSSGSISSADPQGSIAPNSSPSKSSRWWQRRKSSQTCRQLITIAIVLGLQEILEDEIKTAIWGTNKEMDIIIPLALDIQATRKMELGKLFDFVYSEIVYINDAGHEQLARSIRATLQEHNLGNFAGSWKKNMKDLDQWTPYDFLLGVENALSPSEPQTMEPEATATVGVREFRHLPLGRLIHKVKETMHINGTETNGQAKKDAIVEGLEGFISDRRLEVAKELMKQRESIVQEWRISLSQH